MPHLWIDHEVDADVRHDDRHFNRWFVPLTLERIDTRRGSQRIRLIDDRRCVDEDNAPHFRERILAQFVGEVEKQRFAIGQFERLPGDELFGAEVPILHQTFDLQRKALSSFRFPLVRLTVLIRCVRTMPVRSSSNGRGRMWHLRIERRSGYFQVMHEARLRWSVRVNTTSLTFGRSVVDWKTHFIELLRRSSTEMLSSSTCSMALEC